MATGRRTTATDTGIQKLLISEQVNMIDWTEAPLVKRLGLDNERKFRFGTFGSGKLEWFDDTMSPDADTITEAVGDTTGEALTVANGSYFRAGNVISIDTEYFYVRSVVGNVLTVTRGYGATTAATHSDNAAVSILSIAKTEGANYVLGHTTTFTNRYNYSQEIEESVEQSWKNKSTERYIVGDELDYHLAKLIGGRSEIGGRGKAGKLIKVLARIPYYGKRVQGSGTTTAASAGGIDVFVSDNNGGSSTTELTQSLIETTMANIYDDGGSPDLLVVGSYGIRKINAMFKDSIRTERSETEGGNVIKSIMTAFGTLEVMFDKWIPAGAGYLLDTDRCGWVTVNPFDVFDMPSLGTYDAKMVWGEYSWVQVLDKAHAKITFSTSL